MITLRCTDCMTVILFYRDDRIPKRFTCPACLDALEEQMVQAMANRYDDKADAEQRDYNFDRPIKRMADFD